MLSSLLHNTLLSRLGVAPVFGWTDSTTYLQWLQGQGRYKQFVPNRVQKINVKDEIMLQYVPSKENLTDIGSWGSSKLQWNETRNDDETMKWSFLTWSSDQLAKAYR